MEILSLPSPRMYLFLVGCVYFFVCLQNGLKSYRVLMKFLSQHWHKVQMIMCNIEGVGQMYGLYNYSY